MLSEILIVDFVALRGFIFQREFVMSQSNSLKVKLIRCFFSGAVGGAVGGFIYALLNYNDL